ncbi:MAG: fasciclin domain-containing protein [Planctomycetes bacterium]|nr:fasciclin domain-containing protein [Planctomycetota bacterium]
MNFLFLTLPILLASNPSANTENTCTASLVNAKAPAQNIVETAVSAGQFKTLVAALGAGSLDGVLQGDGPFTVFAPTDAAFSALPEGTVKTLLLPKNKAMLQSILKYHVVSGDLRAKQVVGSAWLTSLQGQRINIVSSDTKVTAGGAQIVKANIECSNGVIHVIDRVILPTTEDLVAVAMADGSFKTLAAALQAASLVETLRGEGPFTVFAPTDQAFAKLPQGTIAMLLKPENKAKLAAVLTNHLVPGRIMLNQALQAGTATTIQGGLLPVYYKDGAAMIGESKILQANIEAKNGVIHVIDRVLLP